MLLVIDVGNTNYVLGVYRGDKLIKCWRMATAGVRTADETGIFIPVSYTHLTLPTIA